MRRLPKTFPNSNSNNACENVAIVKPAPITEATIKKELKIRPTCDKRMNFAVSDGGHCGQRHVEAIEPRPSFDVMKSGGPDKDQSNEYGDSQKKTAHNFICEILGRPRHNVKAPFHPRRETL